MRYIIALVFVAAGLFTTTTPAEAAELGDMDLCRYSVPMTFHNRLDHATTRKVIVKRTSFGRNGAQPVVTREVFRYRLMPNSKTTIWMSTPRLVKTVVKFRGEVRVNVTPTHLARCVANY